MPSELTSSNPKKEVMRSLCSFGCSNDTGITGAGGGIVGGCVGFGGTFRLIWDAIVGVVGVTGVPNLGFPFVAMVVRLLA
jgi:hypothetical protein